jgi:hypothetical protein
MANQSAILSGGYSPWQAPLAALFSGISAAAQPGGFANFGQGVQQGQQNFQQGQQQQQMMDLRRMQMEQAQEEMRRANQEEAQRQAKLDLIKQTLAGSPGSPTPTNQVGNYGAATGGIQTASGAPGQSAILAGMDPQQSALFSQYAQVDPEGAFQMLVERGFAEPEKVEASSGVGKIMEDFNNGLIDQPTRDALLKKETYIAPQASTQTERQRNAQAAGLQPGSPEYQQYMLGRDDTQPGPFQGTGLDAQANNILLTGDPSSPEYASAYSILAMPKVSLDPITGKSVIVQPDLSWATKPTGQAGAAAPQEGITTQQVPGATITSTQGAPVYNETQGKAAGFADRIAAANKVLDSEQSAGTSEVQRRLGQIPLVGNYAISGERQKFEQSERDFINSILRRESGAVISEEEFANARQQYLPQPGDTDDVLAQKKASRERALNSMQREGGPFYKPDAANDPLGIR